MRIHLNIGPIVKYQQKYVKYGFLLTSAAVCFFGGDEIKQHVVEKSQMNTITSYKIRITTKKDKEKLPFYLWVS